MYGIGVSSPGPRPMRGLKRSSGNWKIPPVALGRNDLPGLAKNYYKGTVDPYPSTLTTRHMKGWAFPYEEWPQELKDEYAYNPAAARKLLVRPVIPMDSRPTSSLIVPEI